MKALSKHNVEIVHRGDVSVRWDTAGTYRPVVMAALKQDTHNQVTRLVETAKDLTRKIVVGQMALSGVGVSEASAQARFEELPRLQEETSANEKKIKFLAGDLLPHRVGVVEYIPQEDALLCAPITWAEVMLLRNKEVFDKIPKTELLHSLSVSCLVHTSDAKLMLARRSRAVSEGRGLLQASCAGYVDFPEVADKNSLIPSVLRELKEETNLDPDHIRQLTTVGVIRHPAGSGSFHMEGCFFAETRLASREVLALAEDAKDSWEGKLGAYSEDDVARMFVECTMHISSAGCFFLAYTDSGARPK